MAVSRQGVEVVEQDYGDAPWAGCAVLRKIGERVLWQWLGKLSRRLARFDRENADFLRLSSIQNHEIVFCEARDGAVLVTGGDTDLNQAAWKR